MNMDIPMSKELLLAIDVYYYEQSAKVVGALFSWQDKTPKEIIITIKEEVEAYQSGSFYKRELPCILKLLTLVDMNNLEAIIVDGHCYTNNQKELGLGGYLWKALGEKVPVIGVAKNKFHNTEKVSFPIYRGESKKPLYVSSIGYDIDKAKNNILTMKGNYRIPDILKIVDQKTRN
ncbi:endonuclease V [Tenacibaculum tangerinum]|uniref:Endonuclease V n=1 Tax=Tenacibaculum tangerinum TaxID=3038772 RepID=A0ABY8L373_9FLAO|nr:endonuclease V [Tenacibaculum tangerinum]WGH74653.1 endonuclease V [Tenacibaculum tangerinum]